MNIQQEIFSTVSKMSFTGLNASFYHVRVSAYAVQRLRRNRGAMPSSIARQQLKRVDP
ncbi:hypothetical protein EMIT0357P_80176 [Pseudomonas marginalis]|jgi:hypothetical protein